MIADEDLNYLEWVDHQGDCVYVLKMEVARDTQEHYDEGIGPRVGFPLTTTEKVSIIHSPTPSSKPPEPPKQMSLFDQGSPAHDQEL